MSAHIKTTSNSVTTAAKVVSDAQTRDILIMENQGSVDLHYGFGQAEPGAWHKLAAGERILEAVSPPGGKIWMKASSDTVTVVISE